MDSVLRALLIYMILLVVFRISGKRTMSEATTFDMVLLLIISETVQQALIENDNSITNAVILVITLIIADVVISQVKMRFLGFERVLEGTAVIIIEEGRLHRDRMKKANIREEDIMSAARELQGLERLDQVKFAVLEKNGVITVVPRAGAN